MPNAARISSNQRGGPLHACCPKTHAGSIRMRPILHIDLTWWWNDLAQPHFPSKGIDDFLHVPAEALELFFCWPKHWTCGFSHLFFFFTFTRWFPVRPYYPFKYGVSVALNAALDASTARRVGCILRFGTHSYPRLKPMYGKRSQQSQLQTFDPNRLLFLTDSQIISTSCTTAVLMKQCTK